MKLAELAEAIHTLITNAPPETWSGLVPGTDLDIELALDPSEDHSDGRSRVLVVPIVMDYDREGSQGRNRVRKLSKIPRIAIIISVPFQERDSTGLDVTSWGEVKELLNLREELDAFLIGNLDGITAFEAEPAMELLLDKRWFMSVTEITFEAFQCV